MANQDQSVQPIPADTQIVEQPVIKKGDAVTVFQSKQAWKAPTPKWLKLVALTIVFSMNGITGAVSVIPGISGDTVKKIAVIGTVSSLVAGGLAKATGVVYKDDL